MFRRLLIIAAAFPVLAIAQEDWAAIGHFAGDNASLGAPGRREQRIVFMGDSITQGWSEAVPEYFADGAYVERGIGGQTTPQMLVRFRVDVIDLEPEVVVILAGTNDIAGNTGPATNKMIQDNLASMAEIASANGVRVILASILPVYDYPWSPGLEPAPRIRSINGWLAQYAAENDHIFLDYHSSLVDDRGGMQARFTSDGVHVTPDGYVVMAELAEEAIDEALSRQRSQPGLIEFTPIQGCARTSGNRRGQSCD